MKLIQSFWVLDCQAALQVEEGLINIYGDVSDDVGRAMVVHQKEDDLGRGDNEEPLKTGNAKPRQAYGVISIFGPFQLHKL